ncbi:MAG: extracellular solute-binding protein [Spirochaetales bacterium]|nr:extracellular solute-binding protein [Spirochaetales bacterium]
MSRGWALPLDSWEKTAWYNPDSFLPFTVEGVHYGVPESNYVKHVIYNKALFDAAGVPYPTNAWTWEDFIAAAVATTDREGGHSRLRAHGSRR